jgi:hypothetical protein
VLLTGSSSALRGCCGDRGEPDHGAVWSLPWEISGDDTASIARPGFRLTRRLASRAGVVTADYRLDADPGFAFVWAAHALLNLSPAARLVAPDGIVTRVDVEPDATGGPPWREGAWPTAAGLDRLGPDDGSAVAAVLRDCPHVSVIDGADQLTFALDCDGQPRSTALWRNLRGWPDPNPYRSIGVEPMLGAVFDRTLGTPADRAVVPPAGKVTWRLTITAHRTSGDQ